MRDGLARIAVSDVRRIPSADIDCLPLGSMIPGATESWITLNEDVFRPAGPGLFSAASTLTYALRPEFGGLKPRTLILWGDKDTFGPPHWPGDGPLDAELTVRGDPRCWSRRLV